MTASHFSSADRQMQREPPSGGFQIRENESVGEASRHSPDPSGRLDYIDTLRGLAAVQVLLSHSMLAFFPGIAFASPLSGSLLGYIAATPLFFPIDGASAVCIFFVLSGYVLTPLFQHSRAPGGVHILSRFVRLGVPALAACALSAVLYRVFEGYNQTAALLTKSQWFAESWQPYADLWFVRDALVNGILLGFQNVSMAQWFGLPASALPLMRHSYVAPLWTLSIEFYGSIFVLILARSRSWTLLVLASIVLSRTYLLCFIAGHVAARFHLGDRRPATPWFWAAAFAALGVLVCMASHFWSPGPVRTFCALSTQMLPPCPMGDSAYLMRIYGATLFTVALMQCAPIRSLLGWKGLRSLGRMSFPLYLTHWPIIFGVGSFVLVASAPWIGSHAARCLAAIAGVALTAFAAMAFERVDQVALRFSRAVRKGKLAADGAGERP